MLLFRYSALTGNGHRIHYDADYVRDVEGYPGLIVHGPLQATWLAALAAELGPLGGSPSAAAARPSPATRSRSRPGGEDGACNFARATRRARCA